MEKILLAYSGFQNNERDLEWGLKFVKQTAVKTIIVKVIEPHYESGLEGIGHAGLNSKNMLDKVAKVFSGSRLSATTTIIDGDPSTELIQCAERENVDLIIYGTGGLAGRFLTPEQPRCSQPLDRFMVYSLRAVVDG